MGRVARTGPRDGRGDAQSGEQVVADVQAADALLLGRTTYDIFRSYWPGRTDAKLFPQGTAATRFEQVDPPRTYPGGAMLPRYRRLDGPPET